MVEGNGSSDTFLLRIRQELDKLPLTDGQKDEVAPKLLEATAFLDTRNHSQSHHALKIDSGYFNYSEKTSAVVRHFSVEGLTTQDYLKAALKYPPLFYMSPETLVSRITGVVDRFKDDGLTRKDYLKAALKQPMLLTVSPESVESNITGAVDRFKDDGVTLKDYLKAALKQPALFKLSPDKVESNITGVVDRFKDDGLTRKDYVKAAIKQPTLFCMSPDKVESNITGVVDLFKDDGLTRKGYLRAAVKQPSLFYASPKSIADHITGAVDRFPGKELTRQDYLRAAVKQPSLFTLSPEKIESNITGLVDRFKDDGLTLNDYLKVALKQPSLFTQSPEVIAGHINIVIGFAERGLFQPPKARHHAGSLPSYANSTPRAAVIGVMLANPILLTLADDNFALREVHQVLTDGPRDRKLLAKPRHRVEKEMLQHLGHAGPNRPIPYDGFVAGDPSPTKEQAERFLLRALTHAGLIRGTGIER